jgi:recombinational DNA repair protein RecT
MSTVNNMVAAIMQLRPTEVVRHEAVKNQFINVYNTIWKEGGEAAYEREANHFQHLLRENAKLQACTSISVFFAFIDLAVQGLTLQPGVRALAYLLPRNYKQQTPDGRTVWESRCNLTISGYGEMYLRARACQISHADNPVIVYEGDEFSFGELNGRKMVNFMSRIPRQSNRIIACFVKITRLDNSIDYAVMTEQDWLRLSDYSAKNNAYTDRNGQRIEKANDLYTAANGSIDPAFLAAKCIKHAFKSYPKLNIGKGSQLESQVAETTETFDPYGIEEPAAQTQQQPQDFGPAKDTSTGVTVNVTDEDDDAF